MSNKVLILNSSPAGAYSLTRKMVDEFVSQYTAKNPEATFVNRDLAEHPLGFVDGTWINAKFGPAEYQGENEAKVNALTDELVAEVMDADVIIAGVPVYNLTVPANFKAYIDQVVVAGKTFQYTPEGPKGLVPAGKKLFVMGASGTPYDVLTQYGMNFHGPYLKALFGFIGITDVEVIGASARQPDKQDEAMVEVKAKIATLI
jgi:FMN-dependent NADH-azoreductase